MPVNRPYRRTWRQFTTPNYAGWQWRYILHPKYAVAPEQYVRAFLLIQEDVLRLFQFVEPADKNLATYSFRIHELLLRTCVEVEANCKAILLENGYARPGDWDMTDYRKLEGSHRLSSYRVTIPIWAGSRNVRNPFSAWTSGQGLPWYQAYNRTKHDRHTMLPEATFDQLLDAISGLVVLLASQFWTHDFGPGPEVLTTEGPNDGTESAIGGYFRVKFPDDWPPNDQYEFTWNQIEPEADPFIQFPY
jgi:hypothetical protein